MKVIGDFSKNGRMSGMGISFSDMTAKYITDPLKDLGVKVESSISSQRDSIISKLPPDIQEKARQLSDEGLQKLIDQGQTLAMDQAMKLVNTPENQQAAVATGFDAAAAQTKALLLAMTQTVQTEGVMGLRKSHPVIFYSGAVLGSLIAIGLGTRIFRASKAIAGIKTKKNPCGSFGRLKKNPSKKKVK